MKNDTLIKNNHQELITVHIRHEFHPFKKQQHVHFSWLHVQNQFSLYPNLVKHRISRKREQKYDAFVVQEEDMLQLFQNSAVLSYKTSLMI